MFVRYLVCCSDLRPLNKTDIFCGGRIDSAQQCCVRRPTAPTYTEKQLITDCTSRLLRAQEWHGLQASHETHACFRRRCQRRVQGARRECDQGGGGLLLQFSFAFLELRVLAQETMQRWVKTNALCFFVDGDEQD